MGRLNVIQFSAHPVLSPAALTRQFSKHPVLSSANLMPHFSQHPVLSLAAFIPGAHPEASPWGEGEG
jgi:hypothetical protein